MITYIHEDKSWESDQFNELSLEHQNLFFRILLSSKRFGTQDAPLYICKNAASVARAAGFTKEMITDLCAESFLEFFDETTGELGK